MTDLIRSSHLSVVPALASPPSTASAATASTSVASSAVRELGDRPAPVVVAELTRSADRVVVLASLADKLSSMGYDCLVEVVSPQHPQGYQSDQFSQSPKWRTSRGISDADLADVQEAAAYLMSEPLVVCAGTLVGVGFRGPHESDHQSDAETEQALPERPDQRPDDASGYAFVGAVVVRRPRGVVTTVDAEVVHALVEQALGVLAAEQLQEQLSSQRNRVLHLEQALSTNREIGVAIGILMAGRRCSADEAFAVLRSLSQNSNRKIRDIAAQLAYTGELPEPPAKAAETACGSTSSDPSLEPSTRRHPTSSPTPQGPLQPGPARGTGRSRAGEVRQLPLRPPSGRSW